MRRPRPLLAVAALCVIALFVTPTLLASPQDVDLSVTQTDNPDPVAGGGLVTYTVKARNEGAPGSPNPANGITVALSLSAPTGESTGTFVSASGDKWTCTVAGIAGACSLEGALPPRKAAADLRVVVRAPSQKDARKVIHTATISAAGYNDVVTSNNTESEETQIIGHAKGEIPPEGLTTCIGGGVTSGDHTCATLFAPHGGTGELIEGDKPADDLQICLTVGCAGNSINVIPPEDYPFDDGVQLTLVIQVDSTQNPPEAANTDAYVRKPVGNAGEFETFVIPSCATRVPGLPCLESVEGIGPSADKSYTFKFFSGDPIFEIGDGRL